MKALRSHPSLALQREISSMIIRVVSKASPNVTWYIASVVALLQSVPDDAVDGALIDDVIRAVMQGAKL